MRTLRFRHATLLALSALALAVGAPIACSSSSDNGGSGDGGGGGGGDGSVTGDDGSITGDDGSTGGDGSGNEGGGDDGGGSDVIQQPSVTVHGYGNFTCAAHNGTLQCFGWDTYGELGRGTFGAYSSTPTPVIGMNNVDQVFGLGYHHACALNGATVSCWGNNQSDQLGHDKALDLDAGEGGVPSICSGQYCRTTPSAVMGLTGVTGLALSDNHTCALLSGGTVSCWGANSYGQVGADAGTLVPTPTAVGGLSNVVEIDLGGDSACARKNDGSVWCWGFNYYGTLGVDTTDAGPDAAGWDLGYHVAPLQVPGVTGATAIAVGVYHSCAIVAGGNVTCWGYNSNDQLGHAATLDTLCHGSPCRTDAWQVAGLTGAKELALGYQHSCALKSDETVWCWGANGSGELGVDDAGSVNSATPVQVQGLSGVAHIATGDTHTCAVKHDGSAFCWGLNTNGQLGANPVDGGPDGAPLAKTSVPNKVNGL